MNWQVLTRESQLAGIIEKSDTRPQLIFKHSTRCSISGMAKNRLERAAAPGHIDFHFLDLIAYRSLSGKIAETFSVNHESPQVLLIRNGQCVYDESHSGISMDEIIEKSLAA
jgi:bacillithiol system protein YtxJ